MHHIHPQVFLEKFTCPICQTISKQRWWSSTWKGSRHHALIESQEHIRVGTCDNCEKQTLWVMDNLVFPDSGNAPFPNSEMPENARKLYLEASSIHLKSPRGAAALLRLSIQILCVELGEEGKNINTDIGNLVKRGLPLIVQQALDIVRVTGNDAVHPGKIDTDDVNTVIELFKLINVIVEYMIEMPNKVNNIYNKLPSDKLTWIKDRDKKQK